MVRFILFVLTMLPLWLMHWCSASAAQNQLNLRSLEPIATVSERYQSYNIEMAEVIGAPFWKPYSRSFDAKERTTPAAAGRGGSPFSSRAPIDLSNPRLRLLAAALGPAYVRVSGTWANSVYFQDNDAPPLRAPPAGFRSVLTRAEWRGVVEFARAVDAGLITSFAISAGVRDSDGNWTPTQARSLLDYTRSVGGHIYAAELFNEPNLPALGAAPRGYDPQRFARDEAAFRNLIAATSPDIKIAGPGHVVIGAGRARLPMPMLNPEELLSGLPRAAFQIFSYHFYGAVSPRCAPSGSPLRISSAEALSADFLNRTEQAFQAQLRLRDRFAPHAPIWVTETADASCGGDPWADTYLDSFRYLDQLARLSEVGVGAVFHNTLVGSEYGLLDETTYAPRPDYWAALLWRRLMGRVVLAAPHSAPDFPIYAHCLRDHAGGVALLALNLRDVPGRITVSAPMDAYVLTSPSRSLESHGVLLNGQLLSLHGDDHLPALFPQPRRSGSVEVPPHGIAFIAVPQARNQSCE